jgi:hypothetical protein
MYEGGQLAEAATSKLDCSKSRRRDIIREELAAISEGRCSSQHKGLRRQVQRLIAAELQAALAQGFQNGGEVSDLVRECLGLSEFRDAQGARAVSSWSQRSKLQSRSRSTPSLTAQLPPLQHNQFTRKIQYWRKENGNFVNDVPEWPTDTCTAPILPSKHRSLSQNLWSSINQNYMQYPEESDYMSTLIDHKSPGPVTRKFMNPKDDFVEYREEIFKPGNKLVMRKGGGSMASKAR